MIQFPLLGMIEVIYSGPTKKLEGQTALARAGKKGDYWILVQFDDHATCMGLGWHYFPAKSFDRIPDPFGDDR